MGIWENLGMGGYRGFSRPAARLLQQAVQLAGDLGCEQADTSHLLLAMLQQQALRRSSSPGKTLPTGGAPPAWRSWSMSSPRS